MYIIFCEQTGEIFFEFCPISLSQVKRKKVSQLDAERYIASVIPALDYSDFKKV